MRNFLIFILSFFLFFQPQEGVTSKIYYQDLSKPFSELVRESHHVVLVKPLDQREVFRTELIKQNPMDGKPQEDYVYQEYVQLFEVVRVLKEDSDLAVGETVKMWKEPDYGYELTRMYVQDGISKSPYVQRYIAVQEPEPGKNLILFLTDKEPEKAVYQYKAAEGIGVLKEIEAALLKAKDDSDE